MSERIKGETGERMIEQALLQIMPASDTFTGWAGPATDIGIQCDRGTWRRRMRAALEVAFDELLKDPQ